MKGWIKLNTFRGGMPYEPDVKRLFEFFPVESLKEGRSISHEDIEKASSYLRNSGRYYGLVHSWINRLIADHDIVMEFERGQGVHVLQPHERLHVGEWKVRKGIRGVKRGFKAVNLVQRDRLDEAGKLRLDHVGRVMMVLKTAIQSAKKDLPTEIPAIKSLPKRAVKD